MSAVFRMIFRMPAAVIIDKEKLTTVRGRMTGPH